MAKKTGTKKKAVIEEDPPEAPVLTEDAPPEAPSEIAETPAELPEPGPGPEAGPGGDETLPLSFKSPESRTIRGASYDPDTLQLTVTFKGPVNVGPRGAITPAGPDKVYDYPGVEPRRWVDFLLADSKGAYFSSEIRPFYVGRKRG